jgi:hypothetical protein
MGSGGIIMSLPRVRVVLAAISVWALSLAAQVSLADRAYNTGFQNGYKLGQSDARLGKEANFADTSAYRRATDGYNEDMGSLETYRVNFRAGFEDGYKDGFEKGGGRFDTRRAEPDPPRPRPRSEPEQPRPRPEILRPRPEESAAARASSRIVPEGTVLRLRLEHTLSTRTNRQGDRFTATVSEPVYADGSSEVVIPAGSSVKGTISQAERPGRVKGTATLHLRYETITLPGGQEQPMEATLIAVQGSTVEEGEGSVKGQKTTGRDTATVGGGAALGAIIGAIAGGGKGAAIGAGVGAAAGTGTVLGTRGKDIDLPGGCIMEVRLLHSLDLRK